MNLKASEVIAALEEGAVIGIDIYKNTTTYPNEIEDFNMYIHEEPNSKKLTAFGWGSAYFYTQERILYKIYSEPELCTISFKSFDQYCQYCKIQKKVI